MLEGLSKTECTGQKATVVPNDDNGKKDRVAAKLFKSGQNLAVHHGKLEKVLSSKEKNQMTSEVDAEEVLKDTDTNFNLQSYLMNCQALLI